MRLLIHKFDTLKCLWNQDSRIGLTWDLSVVGRDLEVLIWPMTSFYDSDSSEGNRGVPEGVKSMKKKQFSGNNNTMIYMILSKFISCNINYYQS